MKRISNQDRVEILSIINQMLQEDGCQECAFESREEWENPCSICKRNMRDYYRREVKPDERTST